MDSSKKAVMLERIQNAYQYGDSNAKLLGSILEVLLVLVDQKIETLPISRPKKK